MGNSRGRFGIFAMVLSVMLLVNICPSHGGGRSPPRCSKKGSPCDGGGDCCSGYCKSGKCAFPTHALGGDEKIIEYVADILDEKW